MRRLRTQNNHLLTPAILLLLSFSACAAPQAVMRPRPTGSIGRPDSGRLADGRQMNSVPGARVLDPARCWGTPEAVALLVKAVEETRKAFHEAPDLVIGDFSFEAGGAMAPHQSHQSGRDVDVSLYVKNPMRSNGFSFVAPEMTDVEKTWYFIETLLLTDRVQYVLMDYELQAVLYQYVGIGYSEERLAAWFQYPRGISHREGVIRHAPRHHDHMHIRFKCPEDDPACVP